MALVTTFATTPLTLALFPSWYQRKLAAWKRGEIDWDGTRLAPGDSSSDEGGVSLDKEQSSEIRRLLVCLRLDSLPSIFTFVALLGGGKSDAPTPKAHPTKNGKATASETDPNALMGKRPLEVHGLRMLELTERLSSVMKESEADEWSTRDPVVNAFHTFGQLNNVAVSGEVQLVPEGAYSDLLSERATDRRSDMILLPWSETGNLSEGVMANVAETAPNTFSNSAYNQFISQFLDKAPCNAAIFVNNGFGTLPREEMKSLTRVPTNLSLRSTGVQATAPLMDRTHHIFLPFIGGLDDRVALRFVLRLAKNPTVTATILHVRVTESITEDTEEIENPVTMGTKIKSRIATSSVQDSTTDQDRVFFTSMSDSLASELQSRVFFNSIDSTQPVQDALANAQGEVGLSPKNAGDLVVVGRSHGKNASHHANPLGPEGAISQSLGVFAETLILGSVKASILVVQAGKRDS